MHRHKIPFVKTFIAYFVCTSLLYASFASATTKEDLEASKTSLAKQIADLDKEIKEFNKKIVDTRGEANTLKDALKQLETRRTLLVDQINKTTTRIAETGDKITNTEFDIASTTSHIDKTKRSLAESLRSFSRSNYSKPPIIKLLSAGAVLSDLFDEVKREQEMTESIKGSIDTLHELNDTLNRKKEVFEGNKKILETLEDSLKDQASEVEATKKEKDDLLSQTKAKEAEYQKLVVEKQKKKDSLEKEVLDVEARIKTIVDASKIPKYGKGILQFPVDKVTITQYFGNTPFASQNPQVYNGSGHNGIDLGVPVGTPVYSAAGGIVLGTGNTDESCSGVSYGKWVLIRHDNGLTSLYAHLSRIETVAGTRLTAHQKIGLSGNTGYSTGPHVHFTVYASDAVQITTYRSKVCGTNMTMPIAPKPAYLNPLSYL